MAAAGKGAEAIRYAEDSKGLNAPLTAIAAFCEGVLLNAGLADEAYRRDASRMVSSREAWTSADFSTDGCCTGRV